jgi:Na+/H+ antiporter NhaD/arsenite permease-like protein
MLWVGGQLTFPAVMSSLFLPALVAFVVPLALVCLSVKGVFGPAAEAREASLPGRNLVFFAGTLLLAAVPVAKAVLHVPPFLALLTGLGLLWLITEILGKGKLRYVDERPSLPSALKKVDLPSILFFIGILLAVAALDDAGILAVVAASLTSWLVHPELIAGSLGVLSSVFDNVPLVAGAARMFPLSEVPTDAPFWHWLALTAGTGGSILVVGSAAGIAAMGYSKLRFGWYARRIGLPALAGYAAALGVLWLQSRF